MKQLKQNKQQLTYEALNVVSENVIYQGLISEIIRSYSLEELERFFTLIKIDPREKHKWNEWVDNKLISIYELKHLESTNTVEYRVQSKF